ncbi:MAG: hypothetical protein LBF41_06005, partial [Deltaproteobacteria bacterium]|nr:hypothetical protein [Deltaproteobacteria bacterium]
PAALLLALPFFLFFLSSPLPAQTNFTETPSPPAPSVSPESPDAGGTPEAAAAAPETVDADDIRDDSPDEHWDEPLPETPLLTLIAPPEPAAPPPGREPRRPLPPEEIKKRVAALAAEAEELLFTPDFPHNPDATLYAANVEKALVLYFRMANLEPENPEHRQMTGRLYEIRALFANDPGTREEFLNAARAEFARAARADLDIAFDALPPEETEIFSASDPYIADLAYRGRLARGEVDFGELERRHARASGSHEHNPAYWEELFFPIRAIADPRKRLEAVNERLEAFDRVWAGMPTEVLRKDNPGKFKKLDVMWAFAATLSNLSTLETEGELREKLYERALLVLETALGLPLDQSEMEEFHHKLLEADAKVPNVSGRTALRALKDKFFLVYRKLPGKPPNALLLWGEELYGRADAEPTEKGFDAQASLAREKFREYEKESPDPAKAAFEEGDVLEHGTARVSSWLLSMTPEARIARKRKVLSMALASYRKAASQNPDNLLYAKAVARVTVKLAELAADDKTFRATFDEGARLSRSACLREPDAGKAWLAWGMDLVSMESPGFPGARERIAAEALVAFDVYLRTNSPFLSEHVAMADSVYKLGVEVPGLRGNALALLSVITGRLADMDPAEPAFRFAKGIALMSGLRALSLWPDDQNFAKGRPARNAFLEVLESYGEGLELLSLGAFETNASIDPGIVPAERGINPADPLARFRSETKTLAFMEPPDFSPFTRAKSSRSERLAKYFNLQVLRLLTLSEPDTLPPWHKLQLASFLRRSAAAGYFPAAEETAYHRLALILLTQAGENAATAPEDAALLPVILSEKALTLAELSLAIPGEKEFLLAEAEKHFLEAETLSPGSSNYARARWAARENDLDSLADLLAHAALEEDLYLWPTFRVATREPAFRKFKDDPRFKKAWFGYRG